MRAPERRPVAIPAAVLATVLMLMSGCGSDGDEGATATARRELTEVEREQLDGRCLAVELRRLVAEDELKQGDLQVWLVNEGGVASVDAAIVDLVDEGRCVGTTTTTAP